MKKLLILLYVVVVVEGARKIPVKQEQNTSACVQEIIEVNSNYRKFYITDPERVPNRLLTQNLYWKFSGMCTKINNNITQLERHGSSLCNMDFLYHRNFYDQIRDMFNEKKKDTCDRAEFLKVLKRCREKISSIEQQLIVDIAEFEESNLENFKKICWWVSFFVILWVECFVFLFSIPLKDLSVGSWCYFFILISQSQESPSA